MTIGSSGKGPNMNHRAIMQHLSSTDWKLAPPASNPSTLCGSGPESSQRFLLLLLRQPRR